MSIILPNTECVSKFMDRKQSHNKITEDETRTSGKSDLWDTKRLTCSRCC